MINTLIVFLFFSLVVLVHELGHYLAALRSGVGVISFNIGFGPTIFSYTVNKTKYALNLIPFGGFVQLAGLEDENSNRFSKNKRYDNKSWFARFGIIASGAMMNFILAIVTFILIYSLFGVPQSISNQIGYVTKDSPAAQAGLKKGDFLIAINGQAKDVKAIVKQIHQTKEGNVVFLTVRRKQEEFVVNVVPSFDKQLKSSAIGIVLKTKDYLRVNIFRAIYWGFRDAIGFISLFLVGIFQTFLKFNVNNVSGPVGIVSQFGEVINYGFSIFLRFFAMFNVYIGLFNLLPLPALDGGRLAFLLIEKIIRRPVDKEFEKYVHIIGFMLLLGLILLVTYYDIQKLLINK